MMKNTTIKIRNPFEMVGFLKGLGTASCFVSMRTETEVKMRKTGNPYVGAVKVSRRNGLINVNFRNAVARRCAEMGVHQPEPGETWYVHDSTVEGQPLALCYSKHPVKRTGKVEPYLQYYPHKTLGRNEYFLNGRQLSEAEVKEMKTFEYQDNRDERKPTVITLMMDSIRELKVRKVTILNNTISRIVGNIVKTLK